MEDWIYITAKLTPRFHQMTLDEFLCAEYEMPEPVSIGVAGTKTYRAKSVSKRLEQKVNIPALIGVLDRYNAKHRELFAAEKHDLYRTFYIPKRSGGMRRIDAPNQELMAALRELKLIFEVEFHALYHTSAFAYVKKRSTLHAIQRHQKNESRWFAKLDLHNFFGSTTLPFVMQMLSQVFPFTEVIKDPHGREALEAALSLAFLDGVLPQGTPISPLITNVMMIPVDFILTKTLRRFEDQTYVYTRYADDFTISSRYNFDVKKIEELVVSVLREFNAPFSINQTKTRYGSSAGRNWNLGLMLTKDNQITVGHKRKAQLQSMLHNFITDADAGTPWPVEEIQYVLGIYSYIHSIEPEATDRIIAYVNAKHRNTDVLRRMKEAV